MGTILFMTANPTNLCQLRVGEELRNIRVILKSSQLRDNFQLENRSAVRPQDISQALLETRPSIVHFSGHGMDSGSICIETENSEIHPIEPAALAQLFSQFNKFGREIECVVLNACYSAAQAETIARHVPYVIGINELIEDGAAIAFSEGFYQALGAGESIENAFGLGLVQMSLQNYSAARQPVLLMRELEAKPSLGAITSSLKPFGEVACEAEIELLRDHYSHYYFADVPFCKTTLLPETYLIIGRRGTGKTALCEYFKFQNLVPDTIAIDVYESSVYQTIARMAMGVSATRETTIPLLKDIWEFIVWIAIFDNLKDRDQHIASAYCQYTSSIFYPTLSGILESALGDVDLARYGTSKILQLTNDNRYLRAQQTVKELARDQAIIVAIDTLENVNVDDIGMMLTLSSLVDFAKSFNLENRNKNIYAKIFLMAEIFPLLRDEWILNLSKSIQKEVYMHWRPKDLMRLMCWRLYQYLNEKAMLPESTRVDWRSHKDVLSKIWHQYFGKNILNLNGIYEDTFPYVLRHTQMRPRQLIMLCDEIASKAQEGEQFPIFTATDIIKGIEARTADLANEVLNSYNTVYPKVSKILDAMAGMPIVFYGNELDRRAHSTASHWSPRRYSPADFRQLVAELGVVGRVRHIDEASRVASADFEYFMPDRLGLLSDDLCVIHPMFYKRLRIDTSQNYIVYPVPESLFSDQVDELFIEPTKFSAAKASNISRRNATDLQFTNGKQRH